MHPRLAVRLGIRDGDLVKVSTRRGEIVVPAQLVKSIRPDTVFIPYHWPGKKAANQITNRALDPISKIPEFKVCACKIEKVARNRDEDSAAKTLGDPKNFSRVGESLPHSSLAPRH